MASPKMKMSRFKAFGYKCFMYLNKEHRKPGKHNSRGRAMIHMGIASDDYASRWKVYDPVKNKFYISNQVRFNEWAFPIRSSDSGLKNLLSMLTVTLLIF
jgi:hypothetical protein